MYKVSDTWHFAVIMLNIEQDDGFTIGQKKLYVCFRFPDPT